MISYDSMIVKYVISVLSQVFNPLTPKISLLSAI